MCSRRVATFDTSILNRRYATTASKNLIPALKRRAKFAVTLRVEDLIRVSFSLWPRGKHRLKSMPLMIGGQNVLS